MIARAISSGKSYVELGKSAINHGTMASIELPVHEFVQRPKPGPPRTPAPRSIERFELRRDRVERDSPFGTRIFFH